MQTIEKYELQSTKYKVKWYLVMGYWSLVIVLLLAGCMKKSLTPDEFAVWMKKEENGLMKHKEIGDYIFEVQHKPDPLTALQSADSSGMVYFDLRIKHNSGHDFLKLISEDEQSYYQNLYYFSFSFQQDITIMQNGKEIPCTLFHFERSYDLSGYRTFILGFPAGASDDMTLQVDGRPLGTGIIKFNFSQETLENIPEIVL